MKNKKDSILITEMFMATAGGDFSRCFYGTIQRLTDPDGIKYCFGKISMKNGWICARANNQEQLGEQLDELILMVLDYGLHGD